LKWEQSEACPSGCGFLFFELRAAAPPYQKYCRLYDGVEQLSQLAVIFNIVSQFAFSVDSIMVLSPQLDALQDSGFFEFLDDSLDSSLGDADFISHFPQYHVGIFSQANQYVRMIGQKCPGTIAVRWFCFFSLHKS
jgi:hypothetical protein